MIRTGSIIAALTGASLLAACGGKTARDFAGTQTGDQTGRGGSGGSMVDASAGGSSADAAGGGGGANDTGGSPNTGGGGTGGDVATGGDGGTATGGIGGDNLGGAAGQCSGSLTMCNGECVDPDTDPGHCGGCDIRCCSAVCSDSTCEPVLDCNAGETRCGSDYEPDCADCVDLSTNSLHCGGCFQPCLPDQACVDGRCECPSGLTLCAGACADTDNDPSHCGGCNNACATGECLFGLCTHGPEGPSCAGGLDCNGESCCTSLLVPGGTFPMGRGTETCTDCTEGCPSGMTCDVNEEPEHRSTVTSFYLDKYEVTVGRFRTFVEAYDGTPPPTGAGAHPLIAGSGWDSTWGTDLPLSQSALEANVACGPPYQTWTSTVGPNETYPMNCVSWYEAFAFCAWDGGWLPTEAEWEYAAAGGDENRVYPWGNDTTEPLPANYNANHSTPFLAVGSEPGGNGRWGHADLAGSMWEWTLDWYKSDYYTDTQAGCSDCVNLTAAYYRVQRGGSWITYGYLLRAALRTDYRPPTDHSHFIGFRCARSAL